MRKGFGLLVVLGVFLFGFEGVRPPMHREWTYVTGEGTQVMGVKGGVVAFAARVRVGALEVGTGKLVWEKRLDGWMYEVVSDDARMLGVVSKEDAPHRLIEFGIKDGKEREVRRFASRVSSVALGKGIVYVMTQDRKVVAFDLATGANKWEVAVGQDGVERNSSLDGMFLCGDVLVLALDDIGWECLDAANGKSLWTKADEYAGIGEVEAYGGNVLMDRPEFSLIEARTGNVLWSVPDFGMESSVVSGDMIIGESEDKIVAIDLNWGKEVWSIEGGSEGVSMGMGRPRWLSDSEGIVATAEEFARISRDGKVVWKSRVFFDGWPVFLDDKTMVTCDGDRIMSYVAGPYAEIPIGAVQRKVLAEKMVAEFELLDNTERQIVGLLKEYSAEPLIKRYVEWAKAKQAAYDREDYNDELGMLHYGLLQTTAEMLLQMCGPGQTAALKSAIDELGKENSYRDYLVNVLGQTGDPNLFIGEYISELKANRGAEARGSGQTLETVANSTHPDAVAFMIEVLKDPSAPENWRHEAFINLPRTGGDAGIEAVRSVRAKRAARATWEDRIVVGSLPEREIVSEKTDAKGRTWRLFTNVVLGNYSDLYIAEKLASGWGRPVFTGIFTEDTWQVKAPREVRGVPVAEFLESKWIEMLPDDASLRADGDKDGLTDLAEKRLGTDAAKSDTDGDGLSDSVDPCPNAAPRAMGDTEKIMAACLEARFFADGWNAPAIVNAEKVAPFEMYGYHGFLLWSGEGFSGEVGSMYNTGVNLLGLGRGEGIEVRGEMATARISRYSGGLNGDGFVVRLMKVGEEWFVIEMRLEYVS